MQPATFSIKNFRNHKATSVTLGDFTVLVGPNGSGKTNFLLALDAFLRIAQGHEGPDSVVNSLGGWELFPSEGSHGPVAFALESPGRTEGVKYQLELLREPGHPSRVLTETVEVGDRKVIVYPSVHGGTFDLLRPDGQWQTTSTGSQPPFAAQVRRGTPELDELLGSARSVAYFNLQAGSLGQRNGAGPARSLDASGHNLSAVVHDLSIRDPEGLRQLKETLASAFPEVEELTAPFLENGSVALHVRMRGVQKPLPAGALPAGLLVTIAILVAWRSAEPGDILALEEPDAHLHPQLMQWLVETLRSKTDEVRVVATTHHPWFVDQLSVDEVRLFEDKGEGVVVTPIKMEEGEGLKRIEQALGTLAFTGMLTPGR